MGVREVVVIPRANSDLVALLHQQRTVSVKLHSAHPVVALGQFVYHASGHGFLVEERDIIGIGCDSHSLDMGPSTNYPTHIALLGGGKIGVEVLAG
jgi:kynurenine formamidase